MAFLDRILTQKYVIFAVYSNGISHQETKSIRELQADNDSDNPTELAICFCEELSDILQMHVTDSLYFRPNRDDNTSKGIIVRIR